MHKSSTALLTDILGLIGVALALAAAYAVYNLLPVSPQDQWHAAVLSRAGPNGARAYADAVNDGKITRPELRRIREAAGIDIDAPDFLNRKPLS